MISNNLLCFRRNVSDKKKVIKTTDEKNRHETEPYDLIETPQKYQH